MRASTVAALLLTLVLCPRVHARVSVSLDLPATEVNAGDVVEIPVTVRDGREDVVSYALRVRYDPRVLKLREIKAGRFAGFSDTPLSNPALYERGEANFAAANRNFVDTPDDFNVATLVFEVIGASGDSSLIRVGRIPRGNVTIRRTFGAVRMRFSPARSLQVH